jgi:hypothetical protein
MNFRLFILGLLALTSSAQDLNPSHYTNTAPRSAVIQTARAWRSITNYSLTWSADTIDGTNVQGYNVYVGYSAGDYGCPIRLGNVTNVTIQNLPTGFEYHFAVSSRPYPGSGDMESDTSKEAVAVAPLVIHISFPEFGTGMEWSPDFKVWFHVDNAIQSNGFWTVVPNPLQLKAFYRQVP